MYLIIGNYIQQGSVLVSCHSRPLICHSRAGGNLGFFNLSLKGRKASFSLEGGQKQKIKFGVFYGRIL